MLLYFSYTPDELGPQSQYKYNTTQSIADAFAWDINITDFMEIEKPALSQGIYRLSTNYTLDDRSYDVELFLDDCLTAPTGEDNFPLVFFDATEDVQGDVNYVHLEWTYNQTKIEMSDMWTATRQEGMLTSASA